MRLLPGRVLEALLPARLGRGFRWLFAATVINNVGDGIAIAAGPLLVASQTRDPFVVSLALLCQVLPTLLFGLIGGAVADRVDRRRMVVAVDLARAVVLVVLVATIATASVNIAIVLAALFLLGTAETFADSASSTLVPSLVAREDLGLANSRMQGAFVLTNQLLAPPIGAFLFAVGMGLPFAANAAAFALGAVLVSRIALAPRGQPSERSSLRADMAEGIRWLIGHPPMRTLALTVFAFNVGFGAAWSSLVLYADERLGMDAVGYGLLTTAMAVGGILGTAFYGRLERRISLADLMRIGLLIETGTHLTLALTTSPIVALGVLVVFGIHELIWGTTSTVVRQRSVPDELLGRVGGVYRVAVMGGIVIGTPLGGLLARAWGLTAPLWFGFGVAGLLVVLLWREFDHIAHAGDEAPASPA